MNALPEKVIQFQDYTFGANVYTIMPYMNNRGSGWYVMHFDRRTAEVKQYYSTLDLIGIDIFSKEFYPIAYLLCKLPGEY